jgi:hypothetical protein
MQRLLGDLNRGRGEPHLRSRWSTVHVPTTGSGSRQCRSFSHHSEIAGGATWRRLERNELHRSITAGQYRGCTELRISVGSVQ